MRSEDPAQRRNTWSGHPRLPLTFVKRSPDRHLFPINRTRPQHVEIFGKADVHRVETML